MRRLIRNVISCYLIALVGCNNFENNTKDNLLEINFSDKIGSASSFFKNIEFVPLETTSNNLIRHCSKVAYKEGKFIVFSASTDNRIATYDQSGKLIKCVTLTGKGPGQCVFSSLVAFDSVIYIYDRGQVRVNCYDFDLNFLHSISNVGFFDSFLMYKNKFTCSTNEVKGGVSEHFNIKSGDKVNIYSISTEGNKLLYSDLKGNAERGKYISVQSISNLFIVDNTLYYHSFPGYQLYSVSLKSFKKELYHNLKLNEKTFTDKRLDGNYRDVKDFLMDSENRECYWLTSFYKLKNDVMFFNNTVPKNPGSMAVISDGVEVVAYKYMTLFQGVDKSVISIGFQGLNPRGTIGDDRIIFQWEASQFIDCMKKIRSKMEDKDWEKLLATYPGLMTTYENVSINSNPILLIARLK